MKRERAYAIVSLAVLLLGLATCSVYILFPNLSIASQSMLAIFGVCFISMGISSYISHNKKYTKIRYLMNGTTTLLAHWHYAPHTSSLMTELIKEKKTSAIYTSILFIFLLLTLSFIIFLTNETYSTLLSITMATLSLIVGIIIAIYLPHYYNALFNQPVEALFGEDCFFFLDEIFFLQKSIYLLEDIRIDLDVEYSLQFLYRTPEIGSTVCYSVIVPVPPDALDTAKHIQAYYLELINWTPPEA